MAEKLEDFYNVLKSNPSIKGLPEDYSSFKRGLSDLKNAEGFFKVISSNESIKGLPSDFETFATGLGLKKKDLSQSGSMDGSKPSQDTKTGAPFAKANIDSPFDYTDQNYASKAEKKTAKAEVIPGKEPKDKFLPYPIPGQNIQSNPFKPVSVKPKEEFEKNKKVELKRDKSDIELAFETIPETIITGLSSMPRFFYDASAVVAKKIAQASPTRNPFATLPTYDQVREMTRSSEPGAINSLDILDSISKKSQLEASRINQKISTNKEGYIDLIKNKDYSTFLHKTVNDLIISAPAMAAISANPVVAVEMFASTKNLDLVDNNTVPDDLKPVNAFITGLAEVILEGKIGGTAVLKNTIEDAFKKGVGKEVLEKSIKEMVFNWARKIAPTSKEITLAGAEEVSTNLIQQFTNYYTGESDSIDIQQALDAFAGGVSGASALKGAGVAVGASAKKIKELSSKKDLISKQIDNPNTSIKTKQDLAEEVVNINNEIADEIDNSTVNVELLSGNDKKEVDNIVSQINDVENIINNPEVSEDIKKSLEIKKDQLNDQVETIINSSQKNLSPEEISLLESKKNELKLKLTQPTVAIQEEESFVDTDLTEDQKTIAKQYKERLSKLKKEDPDQYWSVDLPDDATIADAIKNDRLVDVGGGMGIVTEDGNMIGMFKYDKSAKGTAKAVQEARIKKGGVKLDNFDGYLTRTYQKNGFRVVARVPFNEEFAPEGWNKEKHGTPDVVMMVYDPENKLDIEEKTFTDPNTGYEDAQAYRDSFVEEAIKITAPAEKVEAVSEEQVVAPKEPTKEIVKVKKAKKPSKEEKNLSRVTEDITKDEALVERNIIDIENKEQEIKDEKANLDANIKELKQKIDDIKKKKISDEEKEEQITEVEYDIEDAKGTYDVLYENNMADIKEMKAENKKIEKRLITSKLKQEEYASKIKPKQEQEGSKQDNKPKRERVKSTRKQAEKPKADSGDSDISGKKAEKITDINAKFVEVSKLYEKTREAKSPAEKTTANRKLSAFLNLNPTVKYIFENMNELGKQLGDRFKKNSFCP